MPPIRRPSDRPHDTFVNRPKLRPAFQATDAGKGVQFIDVNKDEFVNAAKPVHANYANKLGKALYDKIVNTK